MSHHVFLSYSRQDAPMMRRIKVDLKAAGVTVWTDEGIKIGTTSWKEAIEQAIIDSQAVVVLMSPDSNQSKWVQREIDYAELHDRKLIPLLITGEEKTAIPFALIGSQYVDLRHDYKVNIKQVVQRIRQTLDGHSALTIESSGRHAAEKTLVTHRKSPSWFKTAGIVVMGLLVLGGLLAVSIYGSDLPDALAADDVLQSLDVQQYSEPANVMLRYNARSLVLLNADDDPLNVYGLDFELYEDSENPTTTFAASEWRNAAWALSPGHCLQAWDLSLGTLRADQPPADRCDTRDWYRATNYTFWQSDQQKAVFRVVRDGDVLASCSAADTTTIDTCAFYLPPRP